MREDFRFSPEVKYNDNNSILPETWQDTAEYRKKEWDKKDGRFKDR